MAKVHPPASLNIDQLTRAMDDLDRKIRLALPVVADVFIDVTAYRATDSRGEGVRSPGDGEASG